MFTFMMKDMIDKTIGLLKVQSINNTKVYEYNNKKSYVYYYNCLCECGNACIKSSQYLLSKHKMLKSCGCLKKKQSKIICSKLFSKHNLSKTRLFKIYHKMKERCYNKNSISYALYGNKGIIICKEWLEDFKTFYNWAIHNGYNDNLTIDRVDNNDIYKPENCRWANKKEQANNRRTNHIIVYNGESFTLTQLAEKFKIKQPTLRRRLKAGWSIDRSLKMPALFVKM